MYSESVYNGYEQLEQDPKVRRLHYLMLWTEAQDVEKFLDLLSFAFNEKKPCYCVFEVQGELQKIGIRAIHGVPDSGQSFLDWVGSWAAARKLMIRERMMIMRERWPYLEAMAVSHFEYDYNAVKIALQAKPRPLIPWLWAIIARLDKCLLGLESRLRTIFGKYRK